jgi:hypothetical protein
MDKNASSPLSGRVASPEVDRMHLSAGETPHGRIRIWIVVGHFFNEEALNAQSSNRTKKKIVRHDARQCEW